MKFASEEIRTKAVNAVLSKTATPEQVAAIMGYSVDSVRNWVDTFLTEGRLAPKPNGHRRSCFSEEEREDMKKLINEHPDITLQEIKDHFHKQCSLSAIHKILVKLGLRFKKNFKGQRAGSGRCQNSP